LPARPPPVRRTADRAVGLAPGSPANSRAHPCLAPREPARCVGRPGRGPAGRQPAHPSVRSGLMFSGSTSRQARATAAALALVAIGGCAAPEGVRYGEVSAVPAAYAPVSPPLSIGDIVAGLQAGHAQAQLAGDVRERGLFAPATSADLDLLRQHGAGTEVLEAVQDESASLA